MKTITKVAIYSRKSKFTGKGDSIENQIELCKIYIKNHFGDVEVFVYEDEGFSGGNTNRPEFKRLIEDAKEKKFEALVCYRLDRISRNVADFSVLIKELESYDIDFVSIKEQFDTTSPLGRAMMHISAVFAQLERETIAERIRDNMLESAKSGKWLGGITPTGFCSVEKVEIVDGKEYKSCYLVPIEEEVKKVRLIFEMYLQFESLSKVETYLLNNDILTKNNTDFKKFSIKNILTNPVYCIADSIIYDYFINNNYAVSVNKEKFDGESGVMGYNKTNQKAKQQRQRKESEWIISAGEHKGIISSQDWIKAQILITQNRSTVRRNTCSKEALLSGIIKCSKCGSCMRPKMNRMTTDGSRRSYYYVCELKERSKRQKCDQQNANGIYLDDLIENYIKSMNTDKNKVIEKLREKTKDVNHKKLDNKIEALDKQIEQNNKIIDNLLSTLETAPSQVVEIILQRINDIVEQNNKINLAIEKAAQIENKNKNLEANLEFVESLILSFSKAYDTLDFETRKHYIKCIVEEIVYKSKDDIDVYFLGAKTKK
ncbi:MAG: hypothetical protein ATN36_06725 [Epulopiscium sp. Nele67-Bin005]|nr:MAG: hypothetical protein ATN36_06725 [Epulopiscium sp. Nele67-Bin005]